MNLVFCILFKPVAGFPTENIVIKVIIIIKINL